MHFAGRGTRLAQWHFNAQEESAHILSIYIISRTTGWLPLNGAECIHRIAAVGKKPLFEVETGLAVTRFNNNKCI